MARSTSSRASKKRARCSSGTRTRHGERDGERRHGGSGAVVTGGGGGIGAGIVTELAARGAQVAILDLVAEPAQQLVDALAEDGARGIALTADVSDRSSVDAAIGAVLAEFGRIDILVNNASHAKYVPFREVTEEIWDRMIAVHLKGTFNCTQAVAPTMVAQHYGRIVNIASVAALTGSPLHTDYSAARAASSASRRRCRRNSAPRASR